MMNKIMIRAVGVLIVCLLPLVAFAQQDWQSTSTMTGSGSAYMPEVTSVGSAGVNEMATTTDNYSPFNAPGRPRRTPIGGDDEGDGDDGWTSRTDTDGTDLSPVGDAVLPMTLMALLFGGVVYLRRRQRVE